MIEGSLHFAPDSLEILELAKEVEERDYEKYQKLPYNPRAILDGHLSSVRRDPSIEELLAGIAKADNRRNTKEY